MVDEVKEEERTTKETKEEMLEGGDDSGLLVPIEKYLESGIHIGTRIKTGASRRFIFKKRTDNIHIFDIRKIDERIRLSANFLAQFQPEEILVVATRVYAANAAKKMKKFLPEIDIIEDRFIPGTLTNPALSHYKEPGVILVTDPRGEREALREAGAMNIPTVVLMDSENTAYNADLVVPMNNKGRRSLALYFWLLTRELLVKYGRIKGYDEYKVPLSFFEKLELEEL